MDKRLKVCLIHNVVSFYRLPVFEEIGREVDLDVWFCKTKTADRKWSTDLDGYSFARRVLPVFQLGPFFFNPTLLRELMTRKYDVYLVGDFPETMFTTFATILVAKLRRKPVVLWSETVDHEVNYFQHLSVSPKLHHRLLRRGLTALITGYRRLLLRLPDRYVALSGLAQLFLQSEGVNIAKIHTGIQVMPKQFLPAPTLSKAQSPYAHQKLVLYVGYLNAGKGINLLIDALRAIDDPSVRLVIAGSGPEEAALHTQAAGDERIVFYGYTDGVAKANLMHWADVLVLPTYADCWALVVNEALAYGTPVITTEVAGASELLVEGVNGFVVPSGDQLALKRKLEQVLQSDTMVAEMKRAIAAQSRDITDSRVGARPILGAILVAGATK